MPVSAARRQRHEPQQHAGMNGEVVHALLALLDERVAVDLPGQILGPAAHLLERLVDRHGADRHRGVADDPLAGLVDVLAGGEVHHRVGAPQRRPLQLLDLVLDRRPHRGVADVGVDLHQEVAADDHRLELQVVDVGRDDRAAARHLRPDEFGGQPFARADELHLRGDLAPARIVELGPDVTRGAPRGNPRLAQPGQALAHVVALRAAGVVEPYRRLAAGERHLAQGHLQRKPPDRPASDARCARRRSSASWDRQTRSRSCAVKGGSAGDRRAPSAGFNRIRFQGSVSIPHSGIPLAATWIIRRAATPAGASARRRAGIVRRHVFCCNERHEDDAAHQLRGGFWHVRRRRRPAGAHAAAAHLPAANDANPPRPRQGSPRRQHRRPPPPATGQPTAPAPAPVRRAPAAPATGRGGMAITVTTPAGATLPGIRVEVSWCHRSHGGAPTTAGS